MMKSQIPSKQECYRLICDMEMPDHIVMHSIQVCRVAMFIFNNLKEVTKQCLNENLIMASALLHDITKNRSFKTGEKHAASGMQLLREKGYPEVGYVVGQHVTLDTISDTPTESQIVYYADKRVVHDKITSLKERMEYIIEHYGKDDESRRRMIRMRDEALETEKRLFQWLPFSPSDLNHMISGDCTAEFMEYRRIVNNEK